MSGSSLPEPQVAPGRQQQGAHRHRAVLLQGHFSASLT